VIVLKELIRKKEGERWIEKSRMKGLRGKNKERERKKKKEKKKKRKRGRKAERETIKMMKSKLIS